MKKVIVNKFGGGIMIPEHIYEALKRVEEQLKEGYQPIIVVSALKGVTDKLINIFNQVANFAKDEKDIKPEDIDDVIDEVVLQVRKKHIDMLDFLKFNQDIHKKTLEEFEIIFDKLRSDLNAIKRFGSLDIFKDRILSFGEKLSALLFASFLSHNKIESKRYKTDEVPVILTNDKHLDANINFEISSKSIKEEFKKLKNLVPVLTGFIGRNEKGNTTTLGRGGTDTTACFVAASLEAEKVILWKDVPGVMSADPRIIKNAKSVPYLSYKEAEESGKVIHDKAIQYIKKVKTKAEIASILDYQKKTVVGPEDKNIKGVKIISSRKNLTFIEITDNKMNESGFLFQITKVFNDYGVNMVFIRNTRDSLKFVIENNDMQEYFLINLKDKYSFESSNVNMVNVIGNLNWGMVNDFNDSLARICDDPQIGAFPYKNCVRLEAIVNPDETDKVLKELHKIFIENK